MLATPITELFGIKHPVLLAGMGGVSDAELAAAVTNAGGLGSIGGAMMSRQVMKRNIEMLKEELADKKAPFGVDLLIPQVGGNARKTNKDYTGGHLAELIDIMIAGGTKLFTCAVGVPPKWAVDKLHSAGIPVMNMVGAVKHVEKALAAGADLICAQGGEAGGHTGDVATSVLIPKVVDACRGRKSPLTGGPVLVVAAGGIFDGRGLAMALSMGAAGVWVGTRFVACTEAGAGPYHKNLIKKTGYSDTVRTTIYTGRPMRVNATEFVRDWEEKRSEEIKRKLASGVVPTPYGSQEKYQDRPYLMGQAAGAIEDVKPAKEIVEEMVEQAHELISGASRMLISKL
mmetsp:Transcript_68847/g.155999  ORF Transcript_68847/g.155999 Transcript_68847/m.155999 type:complete len:343 (+) Transcript_68847:90-1118(+)|eukprot:CAMPEP_0197919546 /NCGR_PEP_ID=MMETSP1439-20131203/87385_1 /TAXON_ID=66791 /ORGANISM="Gonyaulax spinifera, Strain CCMP409" /LENGTH=342 /DNA_ID=CAMNT_0043541709 /DNA_START=83 /DNA_END=1111 /DNA_ORIENTATION=+